jgi:hypothetical protein
MFLVARLAPLADARTIFAKMVKLRERLGNPALRANLRG